MEAGAKRKRDEAEAGVPLVGLVRSLQQEVKRLKGEVGLLSTTNQINQVLSVAQETGNGIFVVMS